MYHICLRNTMVVAFVYDMLLNWYQITALVLVDTTLGLDSPPRTKSFSDGRRHMIDHSNYVLVLHHHHQLEEENYR